MLKLKLKDFVGALALLLLWFAVILLCAEQGINLFELIIDVINPFNGLVR